MPSRCPRPRFGTVSVSTSRTRTTPSCPVAGPVRSSLPFHSIVLERPAREVPDERLVPVVARARVGVEVEPDVDPAVGREARVVPDGDADRRAFARSSESVIDVMSGAALVSPARPRSDGAGDREPGEGESGARERRPRRHHLSTRLPGVGCVAQSCAHSRASGRPCQSRVEPAARIAACRASSSQPGSSCASRSASRRAAARRSRERLGRLDDRLVFVVGSPRSGTTFLAGAIGSLPGFVDLGEVAPLKAAVPELAALAARRGGTPPAPDPRDRRDASASSARCAPSSRRPRSRTSSTRSRSRTRRHASSTSSATAATSSARCSRRAGCAADQAEADDAGVAYGAYARFWVEPERRREFEAASDARRAAWVWRAYVDAARRAGGTRLEVRYEQLAARPGGVARSLGRSPRRPVEPLAAALGRAHAESVGRYRTRPRPTSSSPTSWPRPATSCASSATTVSAS